MSKTEFTSVREKYLYHIEEYKKFAGSAVEYCKRHDLEANKFSYHRNYLKKKIKRAGFAQIKIEPPSRSAVVEVFKKAAIPGSVPSIEVDPKWLAELIHNLVKAR